MATASSAHIEPILRESVDPTISKAFEEKQTLKKRIAVGSENINTRGIRVDIELSPNPSFNWMSVGGTFAVPNQNTFLETKVYPVRCSSGYSFDGTWFRTIGTPEALVRGLTKFMAKYTMSAQKKIEQSMFGDGTGELAVVVSSDNSAVVTTSISSANGSTFGTRKLPVNGRYQIYSATGTQRTAGLSAPFTSTLASKVESTGVATFDNIATSAIAATDVVVYEGSWGKEVTGLKALVGNTGTVQAQSRTTYPQLNSGVDNAGQAAISVARLVKNRNAIKFRTEDEPAALALVSSPAQQEAFLQQGYNLIRFQGGGGSMQMDFDKAKFGNHEWIEAVDCPDDRIYGLFFDAFRQYPLKKFGRYNDDGLDFRMNFSNGTGSDAYTGWIGEEFNLGCKNFTKNFVITNLSIAGVATGFSSLGN